MSRSGIESSAPHEHAHYAARTSDYPIVATRPPFATSRSRRECGLRFLHTDLSRVTEALGLLAHLRRVREAASGMSGGASRTLAADAARMRAVHVISVEAGIGKTHAAI